MKQKIDKWRIQNEYETYGLALCYSCRYFTVCRENHLHGHCSLMKKDKVYSGVSGMGICNRYEFIGENE